MRRSSRLLSSQADGFTYERAAISKWLEDHNTSPKTGAPLEFKMLIPNQSLRSMIREFQERQAQASQAQASAAPHQQPAWAVFLEPQAPAPPEASTAAASSGVPAAKGGRGGRGARGRGARGDPAA